MKKIIFRISLYNLLFIFSPLFIFANDQSVVIGLDSGLGSFLTVDGHRKEGVVCRRCPAVREVLVQNLFAEWYLFDSIGIGYRYTEASSGFGYPDGNYEYSHSWFSTNTLLTGNWVFWGETDYVRTGAIIGVGSSTYEYIEKIKRISPTKKTVSPYETSGSAFLFGLFLDWGGESFGARLGYDYVMTILDPLVIESISYQADGSYEGVNFGLRWAW